MTPLQDAAMVGAILWATAVTFAWIGAARRAARERDRADINHHIALIERERRLQVEAAHPGDIVTLFDHRSPDTAA